MANTSRSGCINNNNNDSSTQGKQVSKDVVEQVILILDDKSDTNGFEFSGEVSISNPYSNQSFTQDRENRHHSPLSKQF